MFKSLMFLGSASLLTLVVAVLTSPDMVSDRDCDELMGGVCHKIVVTSHCSGEFYIDEKQKTESCPGWARYAPTARRGDASRVVERWCKTPCNILCGLYTKGYFDCDGKYVPLELDVDIEPGG